MTKAKTDTKEPELFAPAEPAPKAKPPAKAKAAPAKSQAVAKIEQMPPPAPPQPRTMLEVIMAATLDPRCDPDKMKALLDMQRDIEERDAKKAFTKAFNALQAELPVIDKDGLIDHGEGTTKSGGKKLKARFATYPNIMAVCGPLLKKHGFTLSNVIEPSADGSRIIVAGYLEHIDGHQRVSRFPLGIDGSGGKNNLQGWGSSQEYGRRYNCVALLNIVSKAPADQDNDGYPKADKEADAGPKLVSKKQIEELVALLEDAELPEERFLSGYKIEAFEEMPVEWLPQAKKDIAAFKKRRLEGKPHG